MIGRRANASRLIHMAAFVGNLNVAGAVWIIWLRERGFSFSAIGLLQMAVTVAMLVAELPSGSLADRLGRRRLVLVGRGLMFANFVAFAALAPWNVLLVACVCLGLGAACVSGAELALLLEVADDPDGPTAGRTRVIGRYLAFCTAGMAVGLAAGGLLQALDWRAVFVTAASAQLIAFLCTAAVTAPPARVAPESSRSTVAHVRQTLRQLDATPGSLLLLVSLSLYGGFISLVYVFAQDLLAGAGIAIVVVALLHGIEALLATLAADRTVMVERWLGRRVVLLGGAALSLGLVAGAGSGIIVLLVGGFVMAGPIENVIETLGQAIAAEQVEADSHATAISLMSFGGTVVMATVTPILGAFGDQLGLGTAVMIGATAALLGVCSALARSLTASRSLEVSHA